MYAVIETGGKQYRVEVGTELEVELLDVEPGKTITIDRVLLVADGDDRQHRPPARRGRPGQRRGRQPDPRPQAHLLQVPAEGPQPGQEGSPPGADRPAHQPTSCSAARAPPPTRRRPLTPPRPSASASRRPPPRRPPRTPSSPPSSRSRAEAGQEGRPTPKKATGQGRRRPRPSRRPRPTPAKADAQGRAAEEAGRQGEGRSGGRGQGRRRRRRSHPRHEEGRVDPMAHKKAGGSVKNGRDSVGQRLGVKAGDGQLVSAGSIIVRQRGMTFLSGPGTGLGQGLHRVRDDHRQGEVRARHQDQEAHPGRARMPRRPPRAPRPRT